MKWQHYLTSVCFAFLGLFAGSFIINQKNSVSAVSDYTYIIDSSNYSSTYRLCGVSAPTGITSCLDYNYIFIVFHGSFSSSSNFVANFSSIARINDVNSSSSFSLPFGSFSSYLLDISYTRTFDYASLSSISGLDSGWYISITFTENNSFGSVPSGSLSITENGTYDVTNYAQAIVDVQSDGGSTDYSDDIEEIKSTIMLIPAVLLVLYFFYAIYRMIMGAVRR